MDSIIIFFIGTTAELIKLFPIIKKTEDNDIPYKIIASGQNNINESKILNYANGGKIDLTLSDEKDIKKTGFGLLKWWFTVFFSGSKKIKSFLCNYNLYNSVFVVHGDTVSTVMGALIGRKMKIPVAHVEAGLRSFHLFNPFPEEIDRLITSKFANVSFAPGQFACENLKNTKSEVVDTHCNTAIDSLALAKKIGSNFNLPKTEYFVFVIHRQENLSNKDFVYSVLKEIIKISAQKHCVFILHKITENALIEFGYFELVKNQNNITLLERQDYFDFINLLSYSSFVITDGGSNQEELSYMGKPCLILRNHSERPEGIGKNAVMYNGQPEMISWFSENYMSYKSTAESVSFSPSEIIINKLNEMIKKPEQH